MPDELRKRLLLMAGVTSTLIGIVGIFVPILPTTPFLLLAAACFARSSERFYRWLLNNKLLGIYIRNYIEKRGMSVKAKLFTIFLLWLAIGLSAGVGTHNLVVRVALLLVAAGVTLHIVFIKAKRRIN